MIDIEIHFCPRCTNKVINEKLRNFWYNLCLNSVTQEKWCQFSKKDKQALSWLQILEKKGLIVTHENAKCFMVKPIEVYLNKKEEIIICSEKSAHLEGVEVRSMWNQ